MRREVFFVADDFGLTTEANAAIVAAHVSGALHGASLMVGQPGTAEAVAQARQHPALQIGWHLHLCHSRPVTVAEWPWGSSPARAGWTIALSRRARWLMRAEIAAQWEQFRATGLPCAFINVHHHLHAHPAVYRALLAVLPGDFPGWIRLGAPRCFTPTVNQRFLAMTDRVCWRQRRRRCPFAVSDTLWGIDRVYRMQSEEVTRALEQLRDGRHEFMFHPRATENDNDFACLIALRRSVI